MSRACYSLGKQNVCVHVCMCVYVHVCACVYTCTEYMCASIYMLTYKVSLEDTQEVSYSDCLMEGKLGAWRRPEGGTLTLMVFFWISF